MTEQDLIDLGFEKEEATEGNEENYHYYTLGELLTNDNENASRNGWNVTLYGEIHDYVFTDITELKTLVELLEKRKVKAGFNTEAFGL
jgi:hypothetical protein